MTANQHYTIHNPPTEYSDSDYEGKVTTVPFEWSGVTEQSLLVEGLVVDVGRTALHVAVTHIHEDTWSTDSFYREVSPYLWFQQIGNSHYRTLLSRSGCKVSATDFSKVKGHAQEYPLHDDSPAVTPGDTVHVHRTVFWGRYGKNGQRGLSAVDICKLPVQNIGVEEGLLKLSERTIRLAKQLVRTAQKREHIEMVSNPRINPNEAFRPFENTPTREGRRGLKDRRVFGNGQVKDHFVDVNAKEQFPDNAILQGDIRFTHTGDVTLIPNIMPFGEGSDDDPLMEVMIEIHSKTVLDRAVGEQQVYVLIDGVKYTAFVDSETSSHYFVNPGHEIVFGGFRAEGQTSDCKQLTNEQREAYFRKIEANDTGRESTYTDKRILESVANNTLNGAMTSGASLMVPLSKLDSIEVVLPTVDN